jgi:hypothetical protein
VRGVKAAMNVPHHASAGATAMSANQLHHLAAPRPPRRLCASLTQACAIDVAVHHS